VRLPGRYLEVGDFEVLAEGLAEGGFPVGEVIAVGLGEQLAERRGGEASSGQVCSRRRGLPVTGSDPA
jgi:hypothetical protein